MSPTPTMLWVLGLLLMDVFTVTVRRLARRRSPMSPDRDHIHHILMRRGYSPRATLGIVGRSQRSAGCGRHGLWRLGVPDWWIFWSFLAGVRGLLRVFFHAVPTVSITRAHDTMMTSQTAPAKPRNRPSSRSASSQQRTPPSTRNRIAALDSDTRMSLPRTTCRAIASVSCIFAAGTARD